MEEEVDIMSKDNSIYIMLIVLFLAIVLFHYSQSFVIGAEYTYSKNVTFLAYNATDYSTQPFEGISVSKDASQSCDNGGYTSTVSQSITGNTLSVSTAKSQWKQSCTVNGDVYSNVASVIELNNFNIDYKLLNKLTIIYSSKSAGGCAQGGTSHGGSSIYFDNLNLLDSSLTQAGQITLTRLSNGQFLLNDGTITQLKDISSNLTRLKIKSATAMNCNDAEAGYSSSSSITISSILVEYNIYQIMGSQCILGTKDYKLLTSSDYLTLEDCHSHLTTNQTINQTCLELGCPTNYTCQSSGVCTLNNTIIIPPENITITINQTCLNGLSCPSSFICNTDGTCSKTITIEPTFFQRYGLAGMILLLMGSVIFYLIVRGRK